MPPRSVGEGGRRLGDVAKPERGLVGKACGPSLSGQACERALREKRKDRKRAPMMEAWNRLRATYPDSVWAARVPPNQEDEPEV